MPVARCYFASLYAPFWVADFFIYKISCVDFTHFRATFADS